MGAYIFMYNTATFLEISYHLSSKILFLLNQLN